jgi:magnesium-transporting ATPase (P-type)
MADDRSSHNRSNRPRPGRPPRGLAIFIALLVRRRKLRALEWEQAWRSVAPLVPSEIQGLSEAEASARKEEGQINTIDLTPRRTRREIISQNTVSIFNLSLIGIAIVQLLLGKPLDALISLGVMLLNIGLNVFQEMFAKRRLRDIELTNHPRVTVIRQGKAHSIDADDIVIDDVLVLGPGDQLFVDGQLVGEGQITVDESILSGKSGSLIKGSGDMVYAGSFCVAGRAVYRTTHVGSQRRIIELYQVAKDGQSQKELTSIESIIDRILKIMLLFVAAFTLILLSRYFSGAVDVPVEEVIDIANVIFSIAPAGLFFMIFLTYAAGTADLGKLGALVHRARSVESMARVDVMCFARDGVLTGTRVEMETVESLSGEENIPEPRIRQILGDYVRSSTLDNLATRAIWNNFEGDQRIALEEAPFYSVFGWSAVVFNDRDLRGVYILGDELVLEHHLIKDGDDSSGDEEEKPGALGTVFGRVSGLFNRQSSVDESNSEPEGNLQSLSGKNSLADSQDRDESEPVEDKTRENVFKRLFARAGSLIRRGEEETEEEGEPAEAEAKHAELLFAYCPEITRLYDDEGMPQLPDGIIPLARLRYYEQIRPEAVETIEKFSETGVSIKVFSPGNPERTVSLLARAGMGQGDGSIHQAISGADLAHMNPRQLAGAAESYNVFGHLAPQDAARLVEALRRSGHYVAVLGDGVNDVPALRQADLSIVMQSSSQAAQSVADIILLEDSPTVLQQVLDKGQRIVTGLLDVLKLYLVQIFYIVLMILAVRLIATGFPYKSAQGSLIAAVTVTIPALAITFWASPGIIHSTRLRRLLSHFVVPAAITMSTAGMVVYRYFLFQYNNLGYAQLAVTYVLCITGLLLVLFLKPPTRLWAGGAPLSGDRRYTLMILVLMVAFYLLGAIPLAEQFLYFTWLERPGDYLVIAAATIWWAFTLRFIWFLWPLEADERSPARYIFSRLNLSALFSRSPREI